MSRRKAPLAPSSLTSLVDVLFILVFAALVQRSSVATGAQREGDQAAAAGAEIATEEREPEPVAAPRWRPPPQVEALRQAAISQFAASLQERPAIIARVSARGVLTSIEVASGGVADALTAGAGAAGSTSRGGDGRRALAMELPLLEPVEDADIGVGYVGDRDERQRLCAVIAARLSGTTGTAGPYSLARALVVIAAEAPLADLMVALVSGLRRDVTHCLIAHQAAAVLLDPAAMPAAGAAAPVEPAAVEPARNSLEAPAGADADAGFSPSNAGGAR